jgi:SecD/SecF fusion protein
MHIQLFAGVLPLIGSLLFATMPVGCTDPPDIDRVGGEIYVYELAPDADGTPIQLNADAKRSMVSGLETRIDPAGTQGIRISFNRLGQVEIAVPGQDEAQRARVRKLATSTGRLEFLILANRTDHADLISKAADTKAKMVKDGDTVVGRWVEAFKQVEGGELIATVSDGTHVIRDGDTGQLFEWPEEERQRVPSMPRIVEHLLRDKGIKKLEVLLVVDRDPALNFQGAHLASVSESVDEAVGPCLNFAATNQGAKILTAVTSTNLPDRQTGLRRKLGIVFDDQLISAPAIMGTISDRGRITGNFSREEVQFLVAVLQAGELPAPLAKTPVETIVVKPATR